MCVLIRIASLRQFWWVHTIYHFQYEKENNPKLSQTYSYGIFSNGLKKEFELAELNKPPVFESLKVYCIILLKSKGMDGWMAGREGRWVDGWLAVLLISVHCLDSIYTLPWNSMKIWGWLGGAMVLGKLPVPWRPTIWIKVGQGLTALAVGAGWDCLDIFTLIYPFSPLSPSLWETARYRLKYCLKGPLNPKQPTNQIHENNLNR